MRAGGKGEDDDKELSIGEYLKREEYSDTFRDDYLIVCLSIYLSTKENSHYYRAYSQ